MLVIMLLGLSIWQAPAGINAAPCDEPISNEVVCENSKPGNPPSEWDIQGAGDPSIQGFATDISINQSETVRFKIKTDASDYRIDIYRVGYYGGNGARKITTLQPSASLPQVQPNCLSDSSVGLIDCGNWNVSASWAVPSNATSGVYIAKLVRESGPAGASHILFVIRDDDGGSDVLFQTSDTTWQAYNVYGGSSLYSGPNGRAYKVSYNRPLLTRQGQCCIGSIQSYFFSAEYPMVRWLERNGYDVSYASGVDTDRRGNELLEHEVFLSVGHDEYWSGNQRANVEAARAAGVNLAFFSGNEVFWKTRWEDSIDSSGTPYRTLVAYKETHSGNKIDPSPEWTGTWRDPRFSPPSDGGKPENALTGTIFMVNGPSRHDPINVPAAEGKLRLWRNTSIASLAPGAVATLPAGVLGFEWDEDADNGFRPAGLVRLSDTTLDVGTYLLDYGSTFGGGTATHSLTFYRAESGALVFGAGTVQWSWGLDSSHDVVPGMTGPSSPDSRMQQATVNLLADMGVQPDSLQSGLASASASNDNTPPSSTITAPSAGATVNGTTVITGTSSDIGGVVGGVEVSLDDGLTWHPADGRENWSYVWNPATIGEFTLRSRAVDDSGNIGPTSQPRTVTSTAAVASFDDLIPERPLTGVYPAGQIDWGSNGWLISRPYGGFTTNSVSFTEGGQEASLTFLVPRRFASVEAANSGMTSTTITLSCEGNVSKTQLIPPSEVVTIDTGWTGPCSTATVRSTNGWQTNFDNFVFDNTDVAPDTTPPVISNILANANGSSATITWTTDENSTSQVEYGTSASYGSSTTLNESLVVNHSVTLTGLALETTYFYRVKSRDGSGNLTVSEGKTFRAECPCSLWLPTSVPAVPSAPDTVPVELGVKFRSQVAGYISGIRFYKGQSNTGTHTGTLWTSSGQTLATATFTGEIANGWQQVLFSAPVAIAANTTYVASYFAPAGGFSYTRPYFGTAHMASPLEALADGSSGGNGVFRWGSSGFPASTYQASNYWVDVVFTTSNDDTVPPLVTSHWPAADATGVGQGAALTATFNEPVAPASIDFELTGPGNTNVPGNLSYDALTRTATFQPNTLLSAVTEYDVMVSGATDTGGNAMAPFTWSFTTGAPARSIWSTGATPQIAAQTDNGALELGLKFRSNIDGYIQGVRFYKGALNSGVHIGNLWASNGTLLARVTFTNESASGWQEALFAAPVAIEADETYVVSYYAPQGGYALSQNYFNTSTANWPLTALASGMDGANGLYRYGPDTSFPTNSYLASNYWVDVVFSTSSADSVAPSLTSYSPASNAQQVNPASDVTATFNEAVTPGSYSMTLKTSTNASVPAAVSYDAGSRTVTLNPTSNLAMGETFTVTLSGARDAAGNTMTSASWSFSTPQCPCSIFDAAATPAVAAQNDSGSIELGLKFRAEMSGYISGIRFFKGPGNDGAHVGNLWSSDGTLLATAAFTNETSSGWQEVTFPAPVAISANTTYIASYFAPEGHYSLNTSYFNAEVVSWPLRALASGTSGGNGVYKYSASSAYPSSISNASNYWVDVVFNSTPNDPIAPALVARSPSPSATNVAQDSNLTATFSEAIVQSSLSFTLKTSSGALVPASVSYDAPSKKATLNPTSILTLGAIYTATVSGAKDPAGNTMSPVSWSFSTQGCPCSLWDTTATPTVLSESDTGAIEVGVRFRSSVAGKVTGIRFYKGPGNTGTHVAHLWSDSGTLLATATFTGESSSGWQQVNFATPVNITANTNYVASYHAPNGGYSRTVSYFTSALTRYPLTAIATTNGLYKYGPSGTFPTNNYSATNYWVDVVFVTP